MGNKKNQRNHRNNHRRSMQRRWHASKFQKKTSEHMKPRQSFNGCLKGSKIVNLDNLQEFIDQLMAHASQCDSQIILSGEKKAGLASIVRYNVPLITSKKVIGPNGKLRWKANLAAVWGQMSTGGGIPNCMKQ